MRGSEVSLRGFRQYELVQCEIGNSPAKTLVFLLQTLQLLELIRPHATILLAPAIIRLFRNLNLAYRVNPCLTLPDKHINLPQLRNNIFRFVSFGCHP